MITRIWRGWTTPENSEKYESYLINDIFPEIERKEISGLHKISLLKRIWDNETEFTVLMLFEDLQAISEFAGEDREKAYLPSKAKELLIRFEPRVKHSENRFEIVFID